MSHDQRPAKLRVVQNAPRANGPRTGGVATRTGANSGDGAGGGSAGDDSGSALSMLPAGIFLVACVVGGIAFAVLRPF